MILFKSLVENLKHSSSLQIEMIRLRIRALSFRSFSSFFIPRRVWSFCSMHRYLRVVDIGKSEWY